MDGFLLQKTCARCGGSLKHGRIMSMFNQDCICMVCKEKETKHPDYKKAQEAELNAVKSGDYNFPGIGYKNEGGKK